jgi:hypothetical protein
MYKNQLFVEIVGDPEYAERYYLYLAKRIYENFYQDRGFIILPKACVRKPLEVVFPRSGIFSQDNRALKLFSAYAELKNFPLWVDRDLYSKIKVWNIMDQISSTNPDVKDKEAVVNFFIKYQQEFLNYAATYGISTKTFKLMILPVCFGTSKTFSYDEKTNTMLLTWRYDLKGSMLYLVEGFISALVTSEKVHKDSSVFGNKQGWFQREAICDYLTVRFLHQLGLEHEVSLFNSTVKSLKSAPKYVKEREACKKYLAELGVPNTKNLVISNVEINNRILTIGEKKLKITDMESKFMDTIIKAYPYAATFDEIALGLWGDDAEKFSLQALARIQSNLRLKLKTLGYDYLLATLRGSGVLLNLESID